MAGRRPTSSTSVPRLLCLLHHLVDSRIAAASTEDPSSSNGTSCPSAAGGAGASAFLARIEQLRPLWPQNIALQSFDRAYYNSLAPELQA